MDDTHPLTRRASMLGGRIKQNVSAMASMMRPGNVPLFSTRLSEQEALAFWQMHRHDDQGAAVLSTMKPDAILDLDMRLGRANQAAMLDMTGGAPPL